MTTFSLFPSTLSGSAKLSLCDTSRKSGHHKRCPAKRKDICSRHLLGLFINLLACLIMLCLISDVFCLQSLKNRYGTVTVISAKPCQNALGQFGTCMFMWDCIKSEGVHLGTCSDRFLFGSCCHHNVSLLNPIEQGKQPNERPANMTTSHLVSGLLQSGGGTSPSSSEESHSRPQSSGDKISDQPTSSATEASSQTPTTADISIVKPKEPDRHILSSQSPSGERLDYVSTSPASNSSSGDHVVSLNQDNLHPPQKQLSISRNHTLAVNDDSSSNNHHEATTASAATTPIAIATLGASISQHGQPLQTLTAVSSIVNGQQKPITSPQQSDETNQVIAYQLVSAPPLPITMSHTTPSPTMTEVAHSQTQRPASWLSRPSLLANAIFHSFKPYLSPNRQRPTYRPFIGGGGFRPQQLRPTVLNLAHPQRPHLFLPINSSANNQQHSNPIQVQPSPSQTTASINESSVQNSTALQQDNNDHHIVNPSTMTDRRRPVDNGRPPLGIVSNGDKLQQGDNQHDMLAGAQQQNAATSFDSMIKVTSEHSSAQNNSSSLVAGSVAQQLGGYLIELNNANSNKTLGIQQAGSASPLPSPIYDYNSSQAHGYSSANNTPNHYQEQPQQQQQQLVDGNASGLLNYPLINTALGTSPIPDVVGPIDEIYGLIDGNQHQQDSQATTGATTEIGHATAGNTVPGGGDQQRPQDQTPVALGAGGSPFPETQTSQSSNSNATWLMPVTNPPPITTTSIAPPVSPIRPASHHHRAPAPNGASLREATCGVTGLYPQTKVVGGKNAAFGAWPWQVSVRKVSFFGFTSMHRCGGAVISSEWIATAGHCVQDLALQSIRIRVGEYDFETITEPYPHSERNARKKIVHPDYNTYTYENDLALIQLDQPLQFSTHVAPICLPPDNIDLVGRNATVTGWGRLNEGGTLPSILQEVIVPIVSNDKCRDMFLRAGRPEYIPDIFLCAGYEEGGRDSCQGDSGGPLQVRGDDGRWMLAGIISWGIGCAEPLLVGVCSAIQRFKPWITATISAG